MSRVLDFKVGDREFRHTPWPAFTAATEWGDIAAEFGEDALTLFLAGGADQVIAAVLGGSAGAELALQTAITYLGAEDLGERVRHYLAIGKVHVRVGGDWLPLYGDDTAAADAAADAAGVDGWEILSAAWAVVREGVGPLFARLASLAPRTGPADES